VIRIVGWAEAAVVVFSVKYGISRVSKFVLASDRSREIEIELVVHE
jgi:hypothetical protein